MLLVNGYLRHCALFTKRFMFLKNIASTFSFDNLPNTLACINHV